MTTKPDPPRKPPYHPNPTVREQIAAGAKFRPHDYTVPGISCAACGGYNERDAACPVDATTGLGPACWAHWRWSPTAERLNPFAQNQETP